MVSTCNIICVRVICVQSWTVFKNNAVQYSDKYGVQTSIQYSTVQHMN